MSKKNAKFDNRIKQIFDDLEAYLNFCRDFGYKFNEGDLYNFKSYAYQQYSKFSQGKRAKNMWEIDSGRKPHNNNHHRGRRNNA